MEGLQEELMQKILTSIDHNRYRPLITYIAESGTSKAIPLYHKGTGTQLNEVEENKAVVKKYFETNDVICNDFKSCIKAFNLKRDMVYSVYDCGIGQISSRNDIRDTLSDLIGLSRTVPEPRVWMKLIADASLVYQDIEDRGYMYFGEPVHPCFHLDAYSGRTRSTGFSIHNKNKNDLIESIDPEREIFVHFDWVAADIRFGGIMSGDNELNEVFNESDPYTYIIDNVGIGSRNDVKQMFLQAVNNMKYNDDVFGLYPKFANWLGEQKRLLDNNKPVYNVAGRPFNIDDEHDKRSAINAVLQGSVAAAVQAAFIKIHQLDSSVLFTDIYDSIVCVCSKSVVRDVINEVGRIIYRPFDGILDKDIRLPYKVSIGTKWCAWQELETIR